MDMKCVKSLRTSAIVAAFILLIGCAGATGNQPDPPEIVEPTVTETAQPTVIAPPNTPVDFTFPLGDFSGEITASAEVIKHTDWGTWVFEVTFTSTASEPYVAWVSHLYTVERQVEGEWTAVKPEAEWNDGMRMATILLDPEEYIFRKGFLRVGEIYTAIPISVNRDVPVGSNWILSAIKEPGHYRVTNNVKLLRNGYVMFHNLPDGVLWEGAVYAEFVVEK
ncbi:MAG: hypothetical protein FWE06_09910 [Oscillospiraceae bacterium]|nr:hypothetical protein [Oscillospiraceae bacterium]